MERPIKKAVGKAHRAPAKKTTTRRRKRRVNGANDLGGMAVKAGGLILGAVGARSLNTLVKKFIPTLSPMLSGGLQVLAGYFLPKFIKGAFWANVGDGMIANGGMVLIVSTGVISGTGLMSGANDSMTYRIGGTQYLNAVSGTDRLRAVSGSDNRVGNPMPSKGVVRTFRLTA